MSISREDIAKYHRSLASFRASDLQKVITVTGQSAYGAKALLVQRASALVHSAHPKALQRIREIGREVYNHVFDLSSASPTMPQRQTPAYNYAQPSRGVPSALPAYRPQQTANVLQTRQRTSIAQPAHLSPTVDNVARVTMTEMPYYKVLDASRHYLVKTTALTARAGVQQDMHVAFNVQADVGKLIAASSSDGAMPRTEVLLRFCVLNSSETQQDEYPDELHVKMNQYSVDTMPPTNPPQRVGTIGKRSNRHTDITTLTHQLITRAGKYHTNQPTPITISLRWTQNQAVGELPKLFAFHVVVVKHVTAKQLIEESKLLVATPAHVTRSALVAHILKQKEDEDILGSEEVDITLKDPLTMTRMRMPVRGAECKHFQCFDLVFWITINEKRPTCKCPVCGQKIKYSTMRPEAYFQDMLAVCPETVAKVKLLPQGNWVAYSEKGAVVCRSNADGGIEGLKVIEIVQPVVSLDEDSPSASGTTGDKTSPTKAPTTAAANKRSAASADDSIIILSDDDEPVAAPPTKRAPAPMPRAVSPSPPQDPVQRAPPPQLSTLPTPTASKMSMSEHSLGHGKCVMYTMREPPSAQCLKDELDDNNFLEFPVVKLFVTRTPTNHRYKVLSAYAEALVAIDEMALAAGMPMVDARQKAVVVWPARDDVVRDVNYPNFPFVGDKPYYSNELQSYMAKVMNQSAVELFVSAAAQAQSYPQLTIVLGVRTPRTAYVYTTSKLTTEPEARVGPRSDHVNVNQGSAVFRTQQQVQVAAAAVAQQQHQQQQQQMLAAQAYNLQRQQQMQQAQVQQQLQQQQQARANGTSSDVVWR